MKADKVATFYQRLQDADPNPQTELKYVNPYTLLVAVALSAQATDVSVNKATGPLFAKVETPEKMVALGSMTAPSPMLTSVSATKERGWTFAVLAMLVGVLGP